MTGRNINIYLQEDIYNQVKQITGNRKISRYINDTLAEKLKNEQKKEQEKFRTQLIADYQNASQDKELKKEMKE
jgi:hypothetical protein